MISTSVYKRLYFDWAAFFLLLLVLRLLRFFLGFGLVMSPRKPMCRQFRSTSETYVIGNSPSTVPQILESTIAEVYRKHLVQLKRVEGEEEVFGAAQKSDRYDATQGSDR